MTNSEARKREAARNTAPNTTGLREGRPNPDCAGRLTPHGPHTLAGPGGNKPGARCDGLPDPTPEPDACDVCGRGYDWTGDTAPGAPCMGCSRYPAARAPEPDATVSDPAPLTDAETVARVICVAHEGEGCKPWDDEDEAWRDTYRDMARSVLASDWLAAREAEAVEQERAARLALVSKIEALADELAERLSTVRVAERIRALLIADD